VARSIPQEGWVSVMDIAVVVGARPNFVKAAALLIEMTDRRSVRCRLIHTGQHYDDRMSGQFFAELEMPAADINLGVTPGSALEQTAEILSRLGPVLRADRPDVVIVVGDVTSTVAGALVANKLGLPLAHVEAGLRSFDRTMPEEINRIITDALADFCFTTEPAANDNLLREGVAAERVHYVGNVMIDTLFRFRERANHSAVLARLGLMPRTYALLTLHRPSNVDDPQTLAQVLAAVSPVYDDVPVIFPVHPRTRQRLQLLRGAVATTDALRLIEPASYLDFMHLMANSLCVLTDSGGIQEETTALGVPCLTLRPGTERPITTTQGTNRIVGLDRDRIEAAWQQIRRGDWPPGCMPDLWDGKAARRILDVVLEYGHR
jgi:UDP-N-acetylglucosamine 2-epimerase (non-hydrolysing)